VNHSAATPIIAGADRLVGHVQPIHERALRAMKALGEHRLEDARKNLDALHTSEPADRAWRHHLLGQLAMAQGNLDVAEKLFQSAAGLALQWGLGQDPPLTDALRLTTDAFTHLGRAHRRKDRLDQAIQAHRAGYQLRCEHGSEEERWESASELGLDHHLAGKFDDAIRWYEQAMDHALRTVENPLRRQAESRGRIAHALLSGGRFEEAATAARAARELWRRHDPGGLAAFRAELHLATALLAQAREQFEVDPAKVRTLAEEAVEQLTVARDELAAFGRDAASDVRACDDQLDFAARLRAAIA
jgi:tetratricopeptide (TPR) repeat protein